MTIIQIYMIRTNPVMNDSIWKSCAGYNHLMKRIQPVLIFLVLLTACSPTEGLIPSVAPSFAESKATLTPIPLPTPTDTPLPTLDPSTLPTSCLDTSMANDIVEGWLQREGFPTLKAAWEKFKEDYGETSLTSSTTDYNDEFAHAVTWQKMLLVGEYPFQIKLPDRPGIGHCSVLIYQGGIGPEVSLGITDAALGGEWSGYASGMVTTEEGTRAYLADRIGKAVTVRYMVSQNPQDVGFSRPGFFSPIMQRLWQGSYYTRIPTEINLLKGLVGQPRGPSIREMMNVAGTLEGYGVFLEYIVDFIP